VKLHPWHKHLYPLGVSAPSPAADLAVERKTFTLLPPAPGKCQTCARAHPPEDPHDASSLYYQVHFYQEHGRAATWADAMAHCTIDMQEAWEAELEARGIHLGNQVVKNA
jgi:hypothetical protein